MVLGGYATIKMVEAVNAIADKYSKRIGSIKIVSFVCLADARRIEEIVLQVEDQTQYSLVDRDFSTLLDLSSAWSTLHRSK